MNKIYVLSIFLLAFSPLVLAQKVAHTGISKTNVSLRGNAVVLGQLTINAPSAGKVILRFDGHCQSAEGDRIVLAASNSTNWGENDGCVELEAATPDIDGNTFSHTRAYDVAAGDHTFFAVGQNFYEMDGNGIASVYGSLTAEWFPEVPGKAFARHSGFFYENIYVEGAPIAFNALTIDAPVSGKVLVRFDGKCVSSYGDLMFFAASNTPTWSNYDGSTSNEVIDNDLNRFSFSHIRTYDVGPGSHTYYAVAENFFETYGNGFVSIYGSLTVQFYPDADAAKTAFTVVNTPFGVNAEGPTATAGQVSLNAPVAGKIAVNLVGTCIGSNGDKIRLAASNTQDWAPNDGNISFEPYSSDLNRVSFSHTRVYDVPAGDHTFYAVIQNVEEFEGSGLAVMYASFSARFFPEGSSAAQEPGILSAVKLSPNPASDFVLLNFPELTREALTITLLDETGRVLKTFQKSATEPMEQLRWDISGLPKGVYFVQFSHASGVVSRPLMRQ